MGQEPISNHVFVKVINNMKEHGFLGGEEAKNLTNTYSAYLSELSERYKEGLAKENERKESAKNSENYHPVDNRQANDAPIIYPPVNYEPVNYAPVKTLTKDEVRERNLSWILNIGVVLILLSGLIFGTTTWDLMNNISKAVLLFCVSLVFFGVSSLAKNVLKIEKTSNAFWVMGSLMLPVSLLSIGFFKLLGDYFSVFGEGKYIFAIFSVLICLPVYFWGTYKFNSRTFSWITLIGVSLLWDFFILSFYPSVEVLFVFLLLFNALFLVFKHYAYNSTLLAPFMNESSLFIQFNLILTTAISLFTYNGTYLYSVNIILASMLFFALSITERTKEYDYVFGLLFSGGIFMLANEFDNDMVMFLAIASIGYIFLGISFLSGKDIEKSKRFNLLSGIIALISFVFISSNIMYSIDKTSSVTGFVSLAVIIVNYFYLYHRTKNDFFGIVIPVKFISLCYFGGFLLVRYFDFKYYQEYMLCSVILIFTLGYMFNKLKNYDVFKYSSAGVAILSTFVLFLNCAMVKPLLVTLPIIGLVFTAELFILGKKNKEIHIEYIIPVSLAFSLCLIRNSYSLYKIPDMAFYFFCAFFVFLLHFAAIKKVSEFKKPLFYMGQAIMAIIYVSSIIIYQRDLIYTLINALLLLTLCYSVFITKRLWERYVFLYASLIVSTIFLYNIAFQLLINYHIDYYKYVLFVSGFLIMAVYPLIKNIGIRKHISIYLLFLTAIMIAGNLFATQMLWYEYAAEVLFSGLLCLLLYNVKLENLNFIPLTLLLSANYILVSILLEGNLVAFLSVSLWFVVLISLGFLKNKHLYQNKVLDWFSIFALLNVFVLPYSYKDLDIAWIGYAIPGLMISLWFFLNSKRFGENRAELGKLLFTISLLWPYYSILASIKDKPDFFSELVFLPPVLITYICTKWIYKVKNNILKFFEYAVPFVSYSILLILLMADLNLLNGMILGIWGLLSLIYGFLLKIKSALFTGGGLILLSVFIQTKDFWFSIEWWIYLLALGLILIAIASFNEYEKNKKNEDVFIMAGKYLEKFKDWD